MSKNNEMKRKKNYTVGKEKEAGRQKDEWMTQDHH